MRPGEQLLGLRLPLTVDLVYPATLRTWARLYHLRHAAMTVTLCTRVAPGAPVTTLVDLDKDERWSLCTRCAARARELYTA